MSEQVKKADQISQHADCARILRWGILLILALFPLMIFGLETFFQDTIYSVRADAYKWFVHLPFAIAIIYCASWFIWWVNRFKKPMLTFLIGLVTVLATLYFSFLNFVLWAFAPAEHLVALDEQKTVAQVVSWHSTRVTYYEYVNFFIIGDEVKSESYRTASDPFEMDPMPEPFQ